MVLAVVSGCNGVWLEDNDKLSKRWKGYRLRGCISSLVAHLLETEMLAKAVCRRAVLKCTRPSILSRLISQIDCDNPCSVASLLELKLSFS